VAHAWAPHVTSTVHPSAVLRAPEAPQRRDVYLEMVTDLKGVSDILKQE
jgi:hypothetical protein